MIKLKIEVNGSLRVTRTLISLVEVDFCQGLRAGDKVTLHVEDPEGYGATAHSFEDTKVISNASTR